MNKWHLASIRDALAKIELDNDQSGEDTFSEASILNNEELVLKINAAAGVSLCKSVLELVLSDINGKHQHFDKVNFIDEGEAKFVVVYQK